MLRDPQERRTWLASKLACKSCGMYRTAEGHDPCIANLPGVSSACCGHGEQDGHVCFTDGRMIRGPWAHVRCVKP